MIDSWPARRESTASGTPGTVGHLRSRGAVVAQWGEKEVDDLFDVRLCLEVGAAGDAARQVADGASLALLDAALQV